MTIAADASIDGAAVTAASTADVTVVSNTVFKYQDFASSVSNVLRAACTVLEMSIKQASATSHSSFNEEENDAFDDDL